MMDVVPLAGLPLTLALSPKGRGKRGVNRRTRLTGAALASHLGRGHPLPQGERAGVRGRHTC